jgi:hypothetical protein
MQAIRQFLDNSPALLSAVHVNRIMMECALQKGISLGELHF